MTMRKQMKADLTMAMKARRWNEVTALRSVLAAIDNAEAVEAPDGPQPLVGRSIDVPRKVLSEADIRGIVQHEIADYETSIRHYEELGQEQEASLLRQRLEVIVRYMTE